MARRYRFFRQAPPILCNYLPVEEIGRLALSGMRGQLQRSVVYGLAIFISIRSPPCIHADRGSNKQQDELFQILLARQIAVKQSGEAR